MMLRGSMNAQSFQAYVATFLAPEVQAGNVVVMDNLSCHKHPSIREMIEDHDGKLKHLPPYSYDYSPIEHAWSKIKSILRQLEARSWEDLVDALRYALISITAEDIVGWVRHCGYRVGLI